MRAWKLVFGMLGVLLVAGRGVAQSGDGRSVEYKEAIRKALHEYELGNWEEAKLFFSDAHRMAPSARTLRGLALTTYALRDYVSASEYFEQAIESRVQPLSAELRTSASELLSQARRFIAHVELSVQPRSAELQIDGRPVVRGPGGLAQLNPGSHELVATASGYETVARRWTVEAGARTRLEVTLLSRAVAASPQPTDDAQLPPPSSDGTVAPPAEVQAPASDARSSSVAPWLVVGISGALAITGGVLLTMTASDIGNVEDAPKGTVWSSVEGAYDRTPAMSTAGFVMLGVGLAGVAAGLTWQFWPDEGDSSALALRVSPTSAAVGGRF